MSNNTKDILRIVGCFLGVVLVTWLLFIPAKEVSIIVLIIMLIIAMLKFGFRLF
jgi:hypothetical protein